MKRLALLILWCTLTAAILFAALEVSVRSLQIGPELSTKPHIYAQKEHLNFHPKPNFVASIRNNEFDTIHQYNSQGLRDREHAFDKPKGTFRILGLGDSFTEGNGVDFNQTYLALLEALLNVRFRGNPPIEIIKAGIAGYEPHIERLYLQHYGLAYKPDMVMVGFTETDVFEVSAGHKAVVTRSGHVLSREASAYPSWVPELYVRSRLMRIPIQWIMDRRRQEIGREKNPDEAHQFREQSWKRILEEYSKILQICRESKIQMAVIYIPFAGPYDEHTRKAINNLEQWCSANKVPFINTIHAFEAHPEKEKLHWPIDGHCTALGYRLIAQSIFQFLLQNNLLPISS